MRIDDLTRRLDEIAWCEQLEHTLAERLSPVALPDLASIETELRGLAAHLDGASIDALLREDGYLVWALRLAALVDPVRARRLAQPHVDSADLRLRYWARKVIGAEETPG